MRNFSFNKMSDAELFICAGVVLQRCVNNPFLTRLDEPLKGVTTTFSIFSAALAAARKDGVDFLAVEDVRRTHLIAALDNLQEGLVHLSPEAAAVTHRHPKADFEVFNAFLAPINVSRPTHISVCNAARAGYVRCFGKVEEKGFCISLNTAVKATPFGKIAVTPHKALFYCRALSMGRILNFECVR